MILSFDRAIRVWNVFCTRTDGTLLAGHLDAEISFRHRLHDPRVQQESLAFQQFEKIHLTGAVGGFAGFESGLGLRYQRVLVESDSAFGDH